MPDPFLSSFDMLARLARTAPDRAVLFSQGEALSPAGLLALTERASAHMAAAGIGRHDLVAVLAQSRAEILIVLLAAARIGAVVLAPDPDQSPDASEALIGASGAGLLIHDSAQSALAVRLGGRVRSCPIGALRARPARPVPPRAHVSPADPCMILPGETATLDHAALAQAALDLGQTCRLSSDDVLWLGLPLTGFPGLCAALVCLGCGGRVVLQTSPPLPELQPVTVMVGTPAIYAALLQEGEAAPRLPHLRAALCTGGPLPRAQQAGFARRFGVTPQPHGLRTYPASAKA